MNGKNYIPPPRDDSDFKQLFRQMASLGAGRPVDKNGIPDGPWTPELLASEIAVLDASGAGVDLRTVQLWFQVNDKGISTANIRWLARIFGCGDPQATSQWQSELSSAHARLVAGRRMRRLSEKGVSHNVLRGPLVKADLPKAIQQSRTFKVAKLSEAMFLDGKPFSAIVLLWAGLAMLIFLGYITGTHHVTYQPAAGVTKQVGLFWSPNWVLDKLIWLPMIVIVVSTTIKQWREEWRPMLAAPNDANCEEPSWAYKLETHSFAFSGILAVSVVIVFLLQWYGAYLRPLTQNAVGARVVDWLLVAIERPDVMSVPEAVAISAFANFLSGVAYWFLFSGLLLLYVISSDFNDLCRKSARDYDSDTRRIVFEVGTKIIRSMFCTTVLSLLISTQIKLVAVYLMTDAASIAAWLFGDAGTFLGFLDEKWSWFDKSPSASITSFFVLFIPCFVFFVSVFQIRSSLFRIELKGSTSTMNVPLSALIGVISLLVANFWLLGRFSGFSLLLFLSVTIAIYSLIDQGLVDKSRGRKSGAVL